jgi:Xaa-Pro aminopeptidase
MMLEQIDQEMRKRHVQAIIVFGETTLADPNFTYVAGRTLARGGVYVKRVGQKPILVTSNLDIGTARKSGRVERIETFTQWGLEKLSARFGRTEALPRLLDEILRKKRVKGRVVLCGRNDLASGTYLIDRLRRLGVRVSGESSPTILEAARETKDRKEIEEIRSVGKKTARVVTAISDTLKSMKRKRGHLAIGKRCATVGAVKNLVSSNLAAEGLTAPEGTIFAVGVSSADPHNSGISTDEIREGKLIVFDIFPQADSGYWFDLTRTFTVGRASSKDRRLYEAVYEAQTECLGFIKAGVTGEAAMSKACDVIERRGYRTIRDAYQGKATNIYSGFIHSLGHGVGLTIGERPYLSFLSKEPLKSGQVVTVEPGVYLPGYGGARVEDTVLITSKGIDNLTSVDKEFELS